MTPNDNSPVAASDTKRRVTPEDLYRYRLVSDPQVSPDGRVVAYVQTRLRKKQNDYASNIWLVPTDGSSEPRRFTGSDKRDMSPRWSPDGKRIAFVSTRSGKPQIWVISTEGGEAWQLTRIKRGVAEFSWSSDGSKIAFTSTVDNEADKAATESKGGKDESSSEASNDTNSEGGGAASSEEVAPGVLPAGRWAEDNEDDKDSEDKGDHSKVFTRLPYKADGGGLLERHTHLFVIAAEGGSPTQITEGEWDVDSPRWSPDSKLLAYLSNKEDDAGQANVQDVFVLAVDHDGKPGDERRVTNHDTAIMSLDWLPSGDGFIVFAHKRLMEAGLGTNPQVMTLDMDGQTRILDEHFDRPTGGWLSSDLRSGTGELRARFSSDGQTVFFPVTDQGNVHVYALPLAGGEARLVVGGERQVLNFGISGAGDGVVFAATTATIPNDLYAANLDGSKERRLTDVNRDVMGSLEVSEPRELWVEQPDGVRVHGWTLLPPGYKEGEKYPLVLQIHGGPHMSFGNAYFQEFQVLAAQGNIILYTNPRGSQGYGQEFGDAIKNDWGGVDYEDIMACLDSVVSQGNIDENRLGVSGGSYGGYMTTWIIGHTQRFRAAVASRMVANIYSAWGSGDFTFMLYGWEFSGTPQERTALYLERSPVTYVDEMKTPLLITHAMDDNRTALEQSEQIYAALQHRKRDVKMVLFPSGGHDISRSGKPSLRIERLEHIAEWFKTHFE